MLAWDTYLKKFLKNDRGKKLKNGGIKVEL
jgi:hypothetical protein